MATQDRRPYLTATVIDQDFLDECADNLECQLELIAEIEAPDGSIIRVSDRNKYVGEYFYEALVTFPDIKRTLGEWLNSQLEFSSLELTLSNADGRFNQYLPMGANYSSWISNSVVVKLGLRDVEASYKEIFSGFITNEGGFKRNTFSITLLARNKWDKLNSKIPTTMFDTVAFPWLENNLEGKIIPFILGDWTTNISSGTASISTFCVNGNNPAVYEDVGFDAMEFVVSSNALTYFDSTNVYMKRGDLVYLIDPADVYDVSANFNAFKIKQGAAGGGITVVDGSPIKFSSSDQIYVRVKGNALSGFQTNIVAQAQHLLETFGGIVSGDYATSWAYFKTKATPAQSAISLIKGREWISESVPLIEYVLSLLEQVRLEAFIDINGKLALNSMHFEEFIPDSSFTMTEFDIEKGTLVPQMDDRTNLNMIQGAFNYEPIVSENSQLTQVWQNPLAITQAGKTIKQLIAYPNLYIQADVDNQIIETLRISSGYPELITATVTWRCLLLDLGGFVALNCAVGAANFEYVPCQIRSINYKPDGLKIEMTLLSYQMLPFDLWSPGYAGITGGQSAVIS
jgi:hypothetical protein